MNLNKTLYTVVLFAIVSVSAFAEGGSSGSHGGGAWVCRENSNQSVRWAKLIDTFEASSNPKISAKFPATAEEALELAKQRIQDAGAINSFIADASTSSNDCPYFASQMNCGFTATGSGTILPTDANTIYRPLPNTCAGGTISREAVALRTRGREVSLVRELFEKLSPVDQVALAFHESLYTYASFLVSATNSDAIRPLTAKLVMLGDHSLSPNDENLLKTWSHTDLERNYWIDFEFRSWSDSAWVQITLEGVDFDFKSKECVATSNAGIALGEWTSNFKCRKMVHILWNDASSEPKARLVIFFPDQVAQSVTREFHLVAHGVDGDIIDYRDQPTQKAFFNKLIKLNVE